jgi:hypothetical protein
MLCAPMLMCSLVGENDFTPHPVTDVDVTLLQELLQHAGLKRIAKDTAPSGRCLCLRTSLPSRA